MNWKEKAIKTLTDSLKPVPTELNELDWKSGLSTKTERLAQHVSAFANLKGGGFLVFGVNNDGSLYSIAKQEADKIVLTLGNIARNSLEQAINIEHVIIDYQGYSLLLIYIPEASNKPVYLRGANVLDCFCRSAGQTVKMSKFQIRQMMVFSEKNKLDEQIAKDDLTADEVLINLNYKKFYELIEKNLPSNVETIMNTLREYGFCGNTGDKWHISNLGAILFANDLIDFPPLRGKSVVLRKYIGTHNRELEFEHKESTGYAIALEKLTDIVMKHTQIGEIRDVVRTNLYIYPKVAIREFIANALIHQDLFISGMSITIEIFTDRMSITNPGASLNDIDRLIDLPPISRNEDLADTMLLLRLCEKRGSGVDKAIEAMEKQQLPAVKFSHGENHTRVIMYPKKELSAMTKEEKIMTCYQHTCLLFEENKALNNQSLRERLGIDRNSSFIASRIIADTLEKGFIKISDESIGSRKYATYIPHYG